MHRGEKRWNNGPPTDKLLVVNSLSANVPDFILLSLTGFQRLAVGRVASVLPFHLALLLASLSTRRSVPRTTQCANEKFRPVENSTSFFFLLVGGLLI